MTQSSNEPNLYQLSGEGIQITYALNSSNGQYEFHYQEQGSNNPRTFNANEINAEQTIFGRLVTVFLVRTVDTGSTTLTVLLPGVNLAGTTSQHIETIAIVTHNFFSILDLHKARQTQTYKVHKLHGTAQVTTATDLVTLSVDEDSYNTGDSISVTVSNASGQTIYFPDHLTNCTVIQLQRQENGSWQNVYPCNREIATQVHPLDSGQSSKVELDSASDTPGLYRATLSYSTSQDSGPQTAIFSKTFQVN